MARVTVEDCLDKVDNLFDLVNVATTRGKALAYGGAKPLIAGTKEKDKCTVIALREIELDKLEIEELRRLSEHTK